MAQDISSSSDWLKVRYRYNRGILHDGDYPHLSTPVEHIDPLKKRVILGFNCFGEQVGECCQRAPEHSDAFNRTVKLYQALASLGQPIHAENPPDTKRNDPDLAVATTEVGDTNQTTNAEKPKGISAKDILKNPALAKLLVSAAKKVKASSTKPVEE